MSDFEKVDGVCTLYVLFIGLFKSHRKIDASYLAIVAVLVIILTHTVRTMGHLKMTIGYSKLIKNITIVVVNCNK